MNASVDAPKIQVTGIDAGDFERVREVAKVAGIIADAAIVRFAFTAFAHGKSISDYQTAHRSVTHTEVAGESES